jgi:hypothetical protein
MHPNFNETGASRTYVDDAYVVGKLRELGLTKDILATAVLDAVRHIFDCTENDPPALAGILGWAKGIRSLREQLIPQKWKRRNSRNFATVEHPKGWCAVTVAAGDSHTGRADKNPSTRSPKGPATADAISANRPEFADIAEGFPRVQDRALHDTWILLYYPDADAGEVRLELSRPAGMNSDGYVSVWSERIIISAEALPSEPQTIVTDHDDDGDVRQIDIDVIRRTA